MLVLESTLIPSARTQSSSYTLPINILSTQQSHNFDILLQPSSATLYFLLHPRRIDTCVLLPLHQPTSTAPTRINSMTVNAKRKWRWSSKSVFVPRPTKVTVIEESTPDSPEGVGNQPVVFDISMDGCSTENGQDKSKLAAKMRRNGSRFLSIVGFSRSSGE